MVPATQTPQATATTREGVPASQAPGSTPLMAGLTQVGESNQVASGPASTQVQPTPAAMVPDASSQAVMPGATPQATQALTTQGLATQALATPALASRVQSTQSPAAQVQAPSPEPTLAQAMGPLATQLQATCPAAAQTHAAQACSSEAAPAPHPLSPPVPDSHPEEDSARSQPTLAPTVEVGRDPSAAPTIQTSGGEEAGDQAVTSPSRGDTHAAAPPRSRAYVASPRTLQTSDFTAGSIESARPRQEMATLGGLASNGPGSGPHSASKTAEASGCPAPSPIQQQQQQASPPATAVTLLASCGVFGAWRGATCRAREAMRPCTLDSAGRVSVERRGTVCLLWGPLSSCCHRPTALARVWPADRTPAPP